MAIWSERKSVRREDISSRQSLRTRFDKWHEKTCRSHDGSHSLSHAYGKLSSGKYYECDSIRLDSICAALHHHIISHPFPSMWVYELRIISKFCTPPPPLRPHSCLIHLWFTSYRSLRSFAAYSRFVCVNALCSTSISRSVDWCITSFTCIAHCDYTLSVQCTMYMYYNVSTRFSCCSARITNVYLTWW